MRGKTTAKERLARMLKQSSSIEELREFRQQVRDVYSIGGALGVDNWIEARRDLGLISGRLINKAADDLQACIGSVIEEAIQRPAPSPPALTWEQKVELLNARETKRRQNTPPTGYRPPPHRKPKPQPKPKPRVERQRPLSPTTTPEPKPTSLLERMAAAWARLTPGDRNV